MGKVERPITLVVPYYENAQMFALQQDVWSQYPERQRSLLHVIIIDDCSSIAPALPHVRPTGVASFSLYRTLVDVRWNWIFCKNLGMAKATTDWVLMTDMDHVVPLSTLERLQSGELHDRTAYRFSRVDAPLMTPYKPHPNSWFMRRDLFDRVGGYDERFSGWYGTDGEFRRRVEKVADHLVILPDRLVRYERSVIADASTTNYQRKETRDRENVQRIIAERSKLAKWRPLRLTFPFEQQL